jgi:hypothetical protein
VRAEIRGLENERPRARLLDRAADPEAVARRIEQRLAAIAAVEQETEAALRVGRCVLRGSLRSRLGMRAVVFRPCSTLLMLRCEAFTPSLEARSGHLRRRAHREPLGGPDPLSRCPKPVRQRLELHTVVDR